MGDIKLSEGALSTIMSGGTIDEPVMQILGHKMMSVAEQDKERFRILISDGKHQISFAMLATQLNEKIFSGELSNHSIIKVKKYITSMLKNTGNKRILVILELEILKGGDEVGGTIGSPEPLSDNPQPANNHSSTSNHSTMNGNAKSTASTAAPIPKAVQNVQNTSIDAGNQLTFPISNLSPYQNKWVIKARVTNKSTIRTWSNSKGEGKLFSMDLMDESGEIRATAFRDVVDKFYDLIEIDKVFYISKGIIKMANKQFNTLKNDYELTFTNETTVQPCFDAVEVPKIHYNFVPINKIGDVETNNTVDVIGVCKEATDCVSLVSKNTNRELKKREVTLVDQSNGAVNLTLWGNEAENFDGSSNPVIVVRGAKVGEFGGGKTLSVLMSSIMKINPDIPEAHRLRGWFDNDGKHEQVTNVSARTGGGLSTEWLTFRDVKERKLGSSDKGDYFQCKATIVLVNSNNAFYKACPTDDCNKKVIDQKNGMYRCEKCNREYPEFKYRLIMSMNLADWTDNQWVSVFTGEAERILGKSSQEVGLAYEENTDSLTETCNKANFSEFIFKCRAKFETYNDESRLKTSVVKVEPINYKEYNNYLISSIKKMVG